MSANDVSADSKGLTEPCFEDTCGKGSPSANPSTLQPHRGRKKRVPLRTGGPYHSGHLMISIVVIAPSARLEAGPFGARGFEASSANASRGTTCTRQPGPGKHSVPYTLLYRGSQVQVMEQAMMQRRESPPSSGARMGRPPNGMVTAPKLPGAGIIPKSCLSQRATENGKRFEPKERLTFAGNVRMLGFWK